MTGYVIGIPGSDQCFRVSYDPSEKEINDVEAIYNDSNKCLFDTAGFFISVRIPHSPEVRVVALAQYLLDEARKQYADDYEAQQYLRDDIAESAQAFRDA